MSAAELLANYRAAHLRVTGRLLRALETVQASAPEMLIMPVRKAFKDTPEPREWDHVLRDRPPTVQGIIRAVCSEYEVHHRELCGDFRDRRITIPRQLVMYLARNLTLRTLPQIGQMLGGRDHTTVLFGIRQVEKRLGREIRLTNSMWLSDVVRLHREALP